MGAGKSTAARELGGTDADHLIESAAGKPIAEIFREEGEAAFRALEEQTIVLALGGGAVASPAVRDALADTLTIWRAYTSSVVHSGDSVSSSPETAP